MTRAECLDEAKTIVTTDRNEQYGEPEDNFEVVAAFWETYLKAACVSPDADVCIGPRNVADLMILFKEARNATALEPKEDTYIDICGYAACGCSLIRRAKEKIKAMIMGTVKK